MTSIVFYDGACPLCSRVVRFVLKHERDKTLKFAKLQGAFAKDFLTEKGINALDLSTFYTSQLLKKTPPNLTEIPQL